MLTSLIQTLHYTTLLFSNNIFTTVC